MTASTNKDSRFSQSFCAWDCWIKSDSYSLGPVGRAIDLHLKRHSLGSLVVRSTDLAVLQLTVNVPDVGAVQFLHGSHQLREDAWRLELNSVHGDVTQCWQQTLCACASLTAVLHAVAVVKSHISTGVNPVCKKEKEDDFLVCAMQFWSCLLCTLLAKLPPLGDLIELSHQNSSTYFND